MLNALAMDPNVRWRGGWRWYGDESMLLERCCLEEERVRREGITIEQYCGLARCQGVELKMKRPVDTLNGGAIQNIDDTTEGYSLEEFRSDIIHAVTNPPLIDEDTGVQQTKYSSRGCFLVTSFARSALHQTGDGHFSPIAAYHPPTDSCLVLDVARFKYAPYWVDVKDLYDAMIPHDMATDKSRGWILMYPPSLSNNAKKNKSISKGEIEGQRPASSVPVAGSGQSICAMEQIKIDYCPAR